jgi:hypothetical protein
MQIFVQLNALSFEQIAICLSTHCEELMKSEGSDGR